MMNRAEVAFDRDPNDTGVIKLSFMRSASGTVSSTLTIGGPNATHYTQNALLHSGIRAYPAQKWTIGDEMRYVFHARDSIPPDNSVTPDQVINQLERSGKLTTKHAADARATLLAFDAV